MNIKRYICGAAFSLAFMPLAHAQEQTGTSTVAADSTARTAEIPAGVIVVEPLFEYPSAPESIEGLTEKSNYLMEHFWEPMDFKTKGAVDQNALNDAFSVYSVPLQWANKDIADKSIDKLISNLQKNPTLLYQFTKAAETNLYGDRARVWIDEVYVKFLEALVKNKKISKPRKLRYELQLSQLRNTMVGGVAPSFDFMNPVGNTETFRPGLLTVIEFGDPTCDDCRHAKLKMDTDVKFSDLVDKGLVNVLFIIPYPETGWQTMLAGYPSKWHVGASETVADIYDLRNTPSIYVIGTDGKIIAKNVPVARAMQLAADAVK